MFDFAVSNVPRGRNCAKKIILSRKIFGLGIVELLFLFLKTEITNNSTQVNVIEDILFGKETNY